MSLTPWIPTPLLATGPWDLAWWQWIGVIALAFVSWIVGRISIRVLAWGFRRIASRTETKIDDELLARLMSPLRMLATIACYRLALPLLELPSERETTATDVLLALLAFGIVWGLLRATDVFVSHIGSANWVAVRPSSRALVSLIGRILKVLIVVIAAVSFLGTIGLPIGSVLAGLGIGGIAIAFGAQKTVENLFGAFAIGVDQPLREGDFVQIEANTMGTVEAVGLRSTRVRTLDRTVVTLPNGRLADMRIETFAPRDRCRLAAVIGLVYDTTAAQLRSVLDGFERVLREHPAVWAPDIAVRFVAFGASSLDIEVIATFQTGDWGVFKGMREEVLIGFMEVVERAGSSFAFPTQTLHVASMPAVKKAA